MNKINITLEMAKKSYYNPKLAEVMRKHYGKFEVFWKSCQTFNNMPANKQREFHNASMKTLLKEVDKRPAVRKKVIDKLTKHLL